MVDVPQTPPSLLASCGVIRWADLVSRAVLLGYAPRGASLTLTTQSTNHIVFLLSDKSSWTTGAVHNVDGGVMAGRV